MIKEEFPLVIYSTQEYGQIIDYLCAKILRERRTVYVLDENKKYLGCIGKKELEACLSKGCLCINSSSTKVIHCNEEEKIVKEIWMNNKKIVNIPIIDEEGHILYELRIDGNDINEYELDQLRGRGVLIGDNVNIINSSLDYTWGFLISIGSNVTITNATIYAHDASMKRFTGKTKLGKVAIGNDVFIGYGSIILPNVHIGNRVIVGAGTVINKDVPDNSVVVGNPAHIVGTFDQFVEKYERRLEYVQVYDINPNSLSWEEKEKMREEIVGDVYIN